MDLWIPATPAIILQADAKQQEDRGMLILPVCFPGSHVWQSWNAATGATVTLNPSDKAASITLSGGDLTANSSVGTAYALVRATQPLPATSPGAGYFEVLITGLTSSGGSKFIYWGIQDGTTATNTAAGSSPTGAAWGYDLGGGAFNTGGFSSVTSIGTPLVNSVTLGCAYDAATGWVYFRNAGGWLHGSPTGFGTGQGKNSTPTTPVYPAVSFFNTTGAVSITFNFGATAFTYGVPAS